MRYFYLSMIEEASWVVEVFEPGQFEPQFEFYYDSDPIHGGFELEEEDGESFLECFSDMIRWIEERRDSEEWNRMFADFMIAAAFDAL